MRRMLSVTLAVVMLLGLAGVALAQGPGWGRGMGMGWGYGPQGMGPGMGPGMMRGAQGGGWGGPGGGPGACPMAYGGGVGGPGAGQPQEQITEEKARDLATEYAGKYFKGFTVERVLPFTGRFRAMYQVELRGPKGETRYLHVNPWGGIRPFAGAPLASRAE